MTLKSRESRENALQRWLGWIQTWDHIHTHTDQDSRAQGCLADAVEHAFVMHGLLPSYHSGILN